jgi:steroid delta-isomerase-like uncharacterized protein
MTANQAKKLSRRLFDEVWNTGDLDTVDELMAPDYVAHTAGFGETIEGSGAFKDFVARMREAFPDWRSTVEHQIAEGDYVAIRWISRGTHDGPFMGMEPTGRRVEMTGTTIFRLQDGKLAEGWAHPDLLGLLQQIGARELVRT